MVEKKHYGVYFDDCPFCGSDDLRLYYDNICKNWSIECSDCNCSLRGYDSMEDVVRLWNGGAVFEKKNEEE